MVILSPFWFDLLQDGPDLAGMLKTISFFVEASSWSEQVLVKANQPHVAVCSRVRIFEELLLHAMYGVVIIIADIVTRRFTLRRWAWWYYVQLIDSFLVTCRLHGDFFHNW